MPVRRLTQMRDLPDPPLPAARRRPPPCPRDSVAGRPLVTQNEPGASRRREAAGRTGGFTMHTPLQAQTRRAVSAAVIGNVLEWYDFAVYAYVATYLARKFFPPGDEVTALLATFLAYGLGFVARPL